MDINVYILSYLNNRGKVWIRLVSWILVFLLLLWWNRGLLRVSIFHSANIFFNVFALIQTVGFYYAFRFILYPGFKDGNYVLLLIYLSVCYIGSCLIVCLPLNFVYLNDWFTENTYINQFYIVFGLKQISDISSKFTLLWFTTISLWCNVFTIIFFLLLRTYQSHQDRLVALRVRDEMELSFLRSQIQPHFLFNTLNNIYGMLIERERESEILLKLSDFMRYSLYSVEEEAKPLNKELQFIRGYLELEFIKMKRNGVIAEFELPNHVDEDIIISPLLILQFLEFVIGHFADEDAVHQLNIKLWNHEDLLQIEIKYQLKNRNTLSSLNLNSLTDWKRRLELHYYQKYLINSSGAEGRGSILLSLKLS